MSETRDLLTGLTPWWREEFRAACHQGDEESKDALRVLDELERLERTVRFNEDAYLRTHGGSWGVCKYKAERDAALARLGEIEKKAEEMLNFNTSTGIWSRQDMLRELLALARGEAAKP